MAMDSVNIVEFPNFFGRVKSGCDARGCVSESSSSDCKCDCIAAALGAGDFNCPNMPEYSFALGGWYPYSAYLRNMHPVPT